jgi:hypothetical protein
MRTFCVGFLGSRLAAQQIWAATIRDAQEYSG